MKPRLITGQLIASSNPIKASLIRRFNIEAIYTNNPIGFKTKSIIYKDKN